jgi:hypothetical protein
MRRSAAAVLLAATLALTGCSSSDSGSDKPAKPTATATSSAPAKVSAADPIAACTDAIVAGKDKSGGAPECASLSPEDYFKALRAANKRGRDALQSALVSASAAAQP